jgi:predicted ATPase
MHQVPERRQLLCHAARLFVELLALKQRGSLEASQAADRQIRRLEICNFRNLESVRIEATQLNVIIGRNDSGKSNLITALSLLFPTLAAEELLQFSEDEAAAPSSLGPGMPYQFTRLTLERNEPATAIGILTGGSQNTWVEMLPQARGVLLAWGSKSQRIASLNLSADFSQYRFYSGPDLHPIDMRRMRRTRLKADNAELTALDAELWGGLRVSLHRGAADESTHIYNLELRLEKYRKDLPPVRFFNVMTEFFGLPKLEYRPVTGVPFPILPTPDYIRRIDTRLDRLAAIRAEIVQTLNHTKTTGSKYVQMVDAEIAKLGGKGDKKQLSGAISVESSGVQVRSLGSGFRSLLVLCHKLMTSDLCLIDEPETYLHPRLQERLADFLILQSKRCQLFVATHSHVLLNALFRTEEAGVYELYQQVPSETAQGVRKVDQPHYGRILDGLGVRPSQILQTNAVLWVEGPTDRIYITKWIQLWSRGKLVEGRDYECFPYGGSLLRHIVLDSQGRTTISLLISLARNSIVVMDSDKPESDSKIDPLKVDVCRQCEASGGFGWITSGRAIENYLTSDALLRAGYIPPSDMNLYLDLPKALARSNRARSNRVKSIDKVELARSTTASAIRSDLECQESLANQLTKVCTLLERWRSV